MEKHANTFFPGDEVFGSIVAGQKVASSRKGIVKDASSDGGEMLFKVEWDDGTFSWEPANHLSKG